MLTSLSLAMLAKERTFSSTVIDLKKKESSQPATETTPAAPAADSHTPSDPSSGKH
jgi:preprotein translocase subunit SecG